MAMCGYVRLCAAMCGCVWLCAAVCGYVRLCVCVCVCVCVCGDVCDDMAFPCFPRSRLYCKQAQRVLGETCLK